MSPLSPHSSQQWSSSWDPWSPQSAVAFFTHHAYQRPTCCYRCGLLPMTMVKWSLYAPKSRAFCLLGSVIHRSASSWHVICTPGYLMNDLVNSQGILGHLRLYKVNEIYQWWLVWLSVWHNLQPAEKCVSMSDCLNRVAWGHMGSVERFNHCVVNSAIPWALDPELYKSGKRSEHACVNLALLPYCVYNVTSYLKLWPPSSPWEPE